MTRFCDLSTELIGEIFGRVPIRSLKSVRSTCKLWNNLSKELILSKAVDRKQFLGFMMFDFKVYSLRFDLQGICKDENLVITSMKKIGKLDEFEIITISHSGGLVLCVTKDNSSLVMWNPYLGELRKIDSGTKSGSYDLQFCLGYDNNRNYKILRYFEAVGEYDIYDFCSNSWRASNGPRDGSIIQSEKDVSLKGNTYFVAFEEDEKYLLCFDFTKERFGQPLCLPFESQIYDNVTLSCVKEEQLAVLYPKFESGYKTVEIWVTDKIEPNEVSWSKFLKFSSTSVAPFRYGLTVWSFFIDEEKKVAVVFTTGRLYTLIIGEDGYYKYVNKGDSIDHPLMVSSSYLPSLVQINQPLKRKERDA